MNGPAPASEANGTAHSAKDEPANAPRDITDITLPNGTPIRARAYGPAQGDARLSIVLGHGIHHLGIDEPRLQRFATELARVGCHVLTPELSELADYRITNSGVGVLRESVAALADNSERVGLIGFSFAGGLALLAAEDQATGKALRFVASVGGYHDLSRTLRFLATNRVEGPDGTVEKPAHEYGLLVLLYGHLADFNLGPDEAPLRSAFRAWLEEDRPRARTAAVQLKSERGRQLFERLEAGELAALSGEILPLLAARKKELAALSPSGRLSQLRPTVILLHGATDSVVPPEETLWGELELSATPGKSYHTLVTPLIGHVGVDSSPDTLDQLALVHLMAQLM